jgi:hypothetical protein
MYADLLCVAASEFDPFMGGVEFTYDAATDTLLATYQPPSLLEDNMFTVVDQFAGNAPTNEILAAAGMPPFEEMQAAALAQANARRSPGARHLPPRGGSLPVRSDPVLIGRVNVLTPQGMNVLAARKVSMHERSQFKVNLLLPTFRRNVSPAVRFTSAGF